MQKNRSPAVSGFRLALENVTEEIPRGRLPSPSSHVLELISELAHDVVLSNCVDQTQMESRNVRVLDLCTTAGPHTNSVQQTKLECENMRVLDIPTAAVPHPFTVEHDDVHDVSHILAPTKNASSSVLVQMFVTTHNKQDQQLTAVDHNMPMVQQVQQGEKVVTVAQ
jgi:hypothetical protein